MDLEEFLEMPDVSGIEEEVYINERLGKFVVRAMTMDDLAEYRKRSSHGKMDKNGNNIDLAKLNLLIVAGQVVKPDFSNAEFLKKANCTTAYEFIKRKLKAGEITTISSKVQEISGFDTDIEETMEDAKN